MYCMIGANYDAFVVLFLKAVVNILSCSGPFLTIKYPVHNSVVIFKVLSFTVMDIIHYAPTLA